MNRSQLTLVRPAGAAVTPDAAAAATVADRALPGWRENLISGLLIMWPVLGMYVDGWAHNNLAALDTFFTPWHFVMYSGVLATSAWFVWLVWRQRRRGRRGLAAVPRGYETTLLSVPVFLAAGVGDAIWHQLFGVEQGLGVPLSPTHLLLIVGGGLMVLGPFRAAWMGDSSGGVGAAPSPRVFLPVLLAVAQCTAGLSYTLRYFSAFYSSDGLLAGAVRLPAPLTDARTLPLWEIQNGRVGIASILITNLILIAPVLYILRRWRPPFGVVTAAFTLPAVLVTSMQNFERGELIAVALVAGLFGDWLLQRLRPTPARVGQLRAFAGLTPLALWSLFLIVERLSGKLAWPPEVIGGTIWWTAISGVVLSLLLAPPALPGAVAPPAADDAPTDRR